jgi:hypothetical protein
MYIVFHAVDRFPVYQSSITISMLMYVSRKNGKFKVCVRTHVPQNELYASGRERQVGDNLDNCVVVIYDLGFWHALFFLLWTGFHFTYPVLYFWYYHRTGDMPLEMEGRSQLKREREFTRLPGDLMLYDL